MRKRQAIKIEKGFHRHNVNWWEIYPLHTIIAAEKRMHAAWLRERVKTVEDGKTYWSCTPSFFIRNRLESFRIRQPIVKKN